MDKESLTKIGIVAEKLAQQVMELGLRWDEAVVAFGLAAKASAEAAASAGDRDDCVEFARQQLEDAFAQDVRVFISEVRMKAGSAEVEDNPLVATARRRRIDRLH